MDDDTWTFDGESKMDGKLIKTRSTIKFPSPDSATMRSEAPVEGGPMTLFNRNPLARQSSSTIASASTGQKCGSIQRKV